MHAALRHGLYAYLTAKQAVNAEGSQEGFEVQCSHGVEVQDCVLFNADWLLSFDISGRSKLTGKLNSMGVATASQMDHWARGCKS